MAERRAADAESDADDLFVDIMETLAHMEPGPRGDMVLRLARLTSLDEARLLTGTKRTVRSPLAP